jgi:hypothetical protein
MPSDQTRRALYDIRDNGKLAQDFVAGLSFERFTRIASLLADLKHQSNDRGSS